MLENMKIIGSSTYRVTLALPAQVSVRYITEKLINRFI
jgi:hypothetical protein